MPFAPRSFGTDGPWRCLFSLSVLALCVTLTLDAAFAEDKGKPAKTPEKAKKKTEPAKENPAELDPVAREMLLQSIACLSTQRAEIVAGIVLIGSSKPLDPLDGLKDFDPLALTLYEASQIGALGNPFGGLPMALTLMNADGSLNRWAEVSHQIPFAGSTKPVAAEKPKTSGIEAAIDRNLLIGVEDEKPIQNYEQNRWEAQAYNYLVAHAARVPLAELMKLSRRDITYVHLHEQPEQYRGQIIHMEGLLRRLIRLDAPKILQNEGIKDIYEGWIYDKSVNQHICVIVTTIPEEFAHRLQTGGSFNDPVAVDGYFFKKYRYKTAEFDQNKQPIKRDAPLLMAPSFVIPAAGPSATAELMPILLITIGGTIAIAVFLSWWYRRGDRAVQSRLAGTRLLSFVEPLADGGAEPPSATHGLSENDESTR